MVLSYPCGDPSSQVTTFPFKRGRRQSHTAPVSTPEKEPTMLNAAYGVLATLPVLFGVAGFAMVSR